MKKEHAVILGLAVAVPAIFLATRRPSNAKFAGFRVELRNGNGQTTRQRDGVQAYDFWHYPLIDLTPDVDGDFTVVWRYVNHVYTDGSYFVEYYSWSIVNVVSMVGGVTSRVELRDTRPGNVGGMNDFRDTRRGESIAYGDLENFFDGLWHRFTSDVSVIVTSPSGKVFGTMGVLDETFISGVALAQQSAGLKALNSILLYERV